jgi:aminopeptidase N
MVRRSRPGALTLLVASFVVLAGCAGTDSGVAARRSTTAGDASPVTLPGTETTLPAEADPSVPSSSTPPSTEPTPDTPDSTGPAVPSTGDGIGDELYPALGNPGVDVQDYLVDIDYDRSVGVIDGSVTMQIEFTQDREQFTVDSLGPSVSSVAIDGDDVSFVADEPELRITPDEPIEAGDTHEVVVAFTSSPDGASSLSGLPSGWFTTPGGSYVLNEPDGARTWLPSNDHPSDKATWTFRITVPNGVTAVANGRLVGTTPAADFGGETWEWREDEPMPTYLMLLVTGDYEIVESSTADGLPLVSAVLRDDLPTMQPFLDGIEAQIEFFEPLFGPYPLDRYGLAITDSFGGLAMETQGRSLFSRDDLRAPDGYVEELLLSHELAHQWFGNAVSPARWGDIWLNESFATYAQWMWLEHIGLTTVAGEAAFALENRQRGDGDATGSPAADDLFGYNSYDGGAIVLHALRLTIGDEAFFELLQRWAADNEGMSRTTDDFIELAETVAGEQLDELFDAWLFGDPPPAGFPSVSAQALG